MRRASSARGSANSLGSAGKAESWPAPHGGYPSERKRSFGQRMKKSASDGAPAKRKTHSGDNNDGVPIRANNESGLYNSDNNNNNPLLESSGSGGRVEAMFIDIMSSNHRYEPPKDPACAAAKEGAGAEEEEEGHRHGCRAVGEV